MNGFKLEPQKITRRGTFKTIQGLRIDDLSGYVKNWLEENKDYTIQIHIGCDSHVGAETKYVTSLCFLRVGKGGHIITKDDYAVQDMSIHDRLANEMVLAINTAEDLKHLGLEITIHVDYNPNPAFKSNELYASGIGTGAWFGYKTVGKPDAWCSSKCADKTTRTPMTRKQKRRLYKQRKKKDSR